jgi:hypothetical protein
MEQHNGFSFTYSAGQQKEVEAIRSKYLPPEEDKMTQLRKLDAGPARKATVSALVVGILGALIMGTGMSLILTDLAVMLKIGESLAMVLGILIGVIGMVLVCLAYPVYNHTLKTERKRIAPEILRLTDELMK